MAQTVLQYGKTSQQRIGPYIVISKRKLSTKARTKNPSHSWFKPSQKNQRIKKSLPNWAEFFYFFVGGLVVFAVGVVIVD